MWTWCPTSSLKWRTSKHLTHLNCKWKTIKVALYIRERGILCNKQCIQLLSLQHLENHWQFSCLHSRCPLFSVQPVSSTVIQNHVTRESGNNVCKWEYTFLGTGIVFHKQSSIAMPENVLFCCMKVSWLQMIWVFHSRTALGWKIVVSRFCDDANLWRIVQRSLLDSICKAPPSAGPPWPVQAAIKSPQRLQSGPEDKKMTPPGSLTIPLLNKSWIFWRQHPDPNPPV